MDPEVTTIPKIRNVYYDTYANLPTSGIKPQDLGYATDRRTLYRWSGSAWQPITIYSYSGLAANIPTASDLPDGSLYYETDTQVLKQVQSSSWVQISSAGDTLVFKTSDETINDSDTLQDDDELEVSIVAGETYALWGYLRVIAGNNTPDIKFNFSAPAGCTWEYTCWGGVPWGEDSSADPDDVSGQVANQDRSLLFHAHIENPTNSGTLTLQWAQLVKTAVNTIVQEGSCIILRQLS